MSLAPLPASGPSAAIASALGGMRRAGTQLAESAQAIARSGAPQAPGPAPDPAPGAAAALAASQAEPDLGRSMVQVLQARRAYEANATVIRAADEMARAALRRSA